MHAGLWVQDASGHPHGSLAVELGRVSGTGAVPRSSRASAWAPHCPDEGMRPL